MRSAYFFIRYSVAATVLTSALWFGSALQAVARPTIDVIESGALEVSPYNPNRLETSLPAVVRIRTEQPIRIEVLPGRLRNGPDGDPSGTERVVMVRHGSHQVNSRSGDRTLQLPAGTTELEVVMQVDRPERFAPGSYTYALSISVVD